MIKKENRKKIVKIFSDGSSYNNGKKDPNKPMYGAYASIITDSNDKPLLKFSDWYEDVTNNQMELFGFIKAATEFFKRYKGNSKYEIQVYSDSQYLVNGVNKYLNNWKRNNWKNSSKQEVKNREMWEMINYIVENGKPDVNFKFIWCKGHNGKSITKEEDSISYFNEKCDSIATKTLSEGINDEKMICPVDEFKNLLQDMDNQIRTYILF